MPYWMEVVSAVLATVGAVLGILATWAGLTRDRPRLRVRVVWVTYEHRNGALVRVTSGRADAIENGPDGQIGIEVMNRGYVPVRVAEVGITPDRFAWWRRFGEFPHPVPRIKAEQDDERLPTLPVEVPVGGCVLVATAVGLVAIARSRRARRAYAITEDDRLFVARSVHLDALRRK